MSYADEQKGPPLPKEWFQLAGTWKRQHLTRQGIVLALIQEGATPEQAERVVAYVFDKPAAQQPAPPTPIYSLPDEVLTKSLGHYERNEFARFLSGRFGYEGAAQLLQRFQVGTSSRWDGASVFWLIDEQNRVRGGQIALYDQTGHKVKYTDREGNRRVCITSVRAALKWKYRDVTPPGWLADFPDDAETWPVPFGLPQLQTTPVDMPVAIVEGPKTAIICSHIWPGYIWLAVGGKSYLKPERLAALRGRKIMLYPDLNAFADWQKRAETLRAEGFDVSVSDLLEQLATDEDKANGLDLADFLLREPNTITAFSEMLPGQVVTPDVSKIEYLAVTTTEDEPTDWNEPKLLGSSPTLRPQTSEENFVKIAGKTYPRRGIMADTARNERLFWQHWVRPPFCWNRIKTHQFVRQFRGLPRTIQ